MGGAPRRGASAIPRAAGRQLAAIVAERDRTADLGGLRVPALVVHGTRDRIMRAERADGPRRRRSPGAELVEVEGMGHDLPRWGLARALVDGDRSHGAGRGRRPPVGEPPAYVGSRPASVVGQRGGALEQEGALAGRFPVIAAARSSSARALGVAPQPGEQVAPGRLGSRW